MGLERTFWVLSAVVIGCAASAEKGAGSSGSTGMDTTGTTMDGGSTGSTGGATTSSADPSTGGASSGGSELGSGGQASGATNSASGAGGSSAGTGAAAGSAGFAGNLSELVTWQGEPFEDVLDYQAPANITVESGNGTVRIQEGDTAQIGVLMEPGVARASDTCDGEPSTDTGYCASIDSDLSFFEAIVESDASGNWLIEANRDGGPATLRADITVWLPNTFNGALVVDQNNGTTEIEGVHAATSLIVESDNGSMNIVDAGGPSELDVYSDNGSTEIVIGEIPPGTESRSIGIGLGDLRVTFPTTDQPYSVQAVSGGIDIVVQNGGNCDEVNGSMSTSLTMVCNGGTSADPVYVVETESSLSEITLVL